MKIKELIEKLNEFDPNCEVVVQSESYYDCSYLARAEFVTATEIHEGTLAKPTRIPAIAITQTKEEIR
jgi:hypothetical protein